MKSDYNVMYINDGTWGVYKTDWHPVAWFVEEEDAKKYVEMMEMIEDEE
ncbi:MAG: hypothetical protein M0P69_13610 [Bacteroidales bacterium]|nr:hypothetical protein [Bacteroidales bacterium]